MSVRRLKLTRKKSILIDRWRITFVGLDGSKPVIEVEELPAIVKLVDVDGEGEKRDTEPTT